MSRLDDLAGTSVHGDLAARVRAAGVATDAALLWPPAPAGCRCVRCGISDAVQGIVLDDAGVCSECIRYDSYSRHMAAYFRSPGELAEIFRDNRARKRGVYDCLLLYSGGKDSTYVLYRLLAMGLKVHTFTFDNGFISKQALSNIGTITQQLDVTHTTVTHANMHEVFRESLARHSTVCKGCFKALLDLSLEFADQQGISIIVNGLSRGQIVEERLKKFYERGEYDPDAIERGLEAGRRIYHTIEQYNGLAGERFPDDGVFDRVRLIDYFRYSDVSKEEIYRCLTEQNDLWKEPEDTGFCSSNCMINDVGIYVHGEERGYSNYEVPTSWEVRLGHLQREAALAELAPPQNPKQIRGILRRIGYAPRKASTSVAQPTLYCTIADDASVAQVEQVLKAGDSTGVLPRVVVVPHIPRDADGEVQHEALRALGETTDKAVERAPKAGPDAPIQWYEFPLAAGQWMQRRVDTLMALEQTAVRRALLALLVRHPPLRASLIADGTRWRKALSLPAAGLPLQWLDLQSFPSQRRAELIKTAMNKVLEKADSSGSGFLVRFLFVVNDARGGSSLIVTAHAQAMDDPLWTRMIAELRTAAGVSTDDTANAVDRLLSGALSSLACD